MQDYRANDAYVYIYLCVCVYYMQVYICVYMCIILEKDMPTHSSNPCLENRMDRRAWQVTVHRVRTESDMTEAT